MGKAEIEASLATLATWIQIFGLLVAVGIVGEVGVGIRHWLLDRRLQSLQHSEDQERQANIARLNNDAEAARRDIANANARAAESNERAAKAEQAAAEANLALEKFKTPRTLSAEQKQRLISKLQDFKGQTFSLNVVSDPEAVAFLQIIRTVLKDAGWIEIVSQVGDITIGGARMVTETGVKIEVAQNADLPHVLIAKTLDAALNAEDISSVPRHNSQLGNLSAINVVVGKKI
jgi:di/tripeptidase